MRVVLRTKLTFRLPENTLFYSPWLLLRKNRFVTFLKSPSFPYYIMAPDPHRLEANLLRFLLLLDTF